MLMRAGVACLPLTGPAVPQMVAAAVAT